MWALDLIHKKNLFNSNSLSEIKNELKKKLKWTTAATAVFDLSEDERILIEQIKEETNRLNRNNVTRTEAYLKFYMAHPEIHWAFLGHMVSRNGGWNMTDLKGDLFSNLLTEKEREAFFLFLERGNWLIFQDVYPQFLLYEESLRRKRCLFHLLHHFNVSAFMETIWNQFWKHGDPYILAVALIINEQSYLEKRVVQNPIYKKSVIDTLEFKLQDILSLNHILFPFKYRQSDDKALLIGQTLHHFSSLHERILLGKRLYSLLFENRKRLQKIVDWAASQPHSGSRKDYWPHLFHDVRESLPGLLYKKRVRNCKLRKGERIYSPKLIYAWKDVPHKEAEIGDWFVDWKVIHYLNRQNCEADGEIMDEYCETIEKIELAILAKKIIFR
ncbi:MAG TPA: DUF2515 domain-containing protein [Bacillus sp. (in: firmicutes)]|uniref:DUF2515 domain-containing protein n=1 Tax=Bacillus litorisediminis TaxID=2922713 RepID=UPI001FAFB57C|nr:DUF2515 domain-containing protein [Bacillus litorisediminis]HWO75281.1 DUF2515 domain-containing protein [Bacillus sp. (in: firmicutes)]